MPAKTTEDLLASLKDHTDGLHGFTPFFIAIGIVLLFLTLVRFMLGVLTCLDLMFNDVFKKSSKKVEDAKKGGASKMGKSSKKNKKKKSKRSSSSKPSTNISISISTKKGDSQKSTSPKPKPKMSLIRKDETGIAAYDSSKKEAKSNPSSSSKKQFKRWIVENRRSPASGAGNGNGKKSSDSSAIQATSVDLLAAPKVLEVKTVSFNNVPETTTCTTKKYESIATVWPGSVKYSDVKLFKSDDCPTPNPFLNASINSPAATTPSYAFGAPKMAGNALPSPKPLSIYAAGEVPSQFATDNAKTAQESSSLEQVKGKQTPPLPQTPKKPLQTAISMPESPAFSVQSTPQATSDTQNSLSLQSPTDASENGKKKP